MGQERGDQKSLAWGSPTEQRPRAADSMAVTVAGCLGGGGLVVLVCIGVLSAFVGKGCDFTFGKSCDEEKPLLAAAHDGDDASLDSELRQTHHSQKDLDTALACASETAKPGAVQRLLRAGADPSAETDDGHPLVAAVSNGNTVDQDPQRVKVVKLLLAAHADPREAIRSAAQSSTAEVVGLLLDAGAPLEGKPDEASPLASAVYEGNDPVVDLLLARGANPNDAGTPGPDEVRSALSDGVCRHDNPYDPYAPGSTCPFAGLVRQDYDHHNPVAAAGSTTVPVLPQPTAPSTTSPTTTATGLFTTIPDGVITANATTTPLAIAVLVNDGHAVVALLAAHADPNRPSLGRYTPLWLAVDLQDEALATALLRAGATADPPPTSGLESPLALARTLPTPDLANVLTGPPPP